MDLEREKKTDRWITKACHANERERGRGGEEGNWQPGRKTATTNYYRMMTYIYRSTQQKNPPTNYAGCRRRQGETSTPVER
mmetsp:Transcript_30998/g.61134  ORF Transcript_30998/g.61134 Transcript_30998/m.61134 type:complete len:81 (-) Transcript_30998:633-875(-)